MRRKKALIVIGAFGLAVFFSIPRIVDSRMNGVAAAPPYTVSPQARALHDRLFVADLHGDTLLWSRDLLTEHSHGH